MSRLSIRVVQSSGGDVLRILLVCASLLGLSSCTSAPPSPPEAARPETRAPGGLAFERGMFSVEFSNFISGVEVPPHPASVYVKITKNDPEAGRVEWSKIHREGDRLGWAERESPPTSLHRVFSQGRGRMTKVDFNAEAKIEKIAVDELVRYEYKSCPILEQPVESCPGPAVTSDFRRVNRVVISTLGGRFTREVAEEESKAGQICTKHKGIAFPPKWTPEEVKRYRLRKAAELYWEAEDFWKSKNPDVRRKAQEDYGLLLKNFPDLEVVRQNLNRIKERSEAAIED